MHSRRPADNRRGFLAALAADLAVRSRAAQIADGRTALRRLNRVEYENTLRDLLEMPALSVHDLLPDDASTAGFDTVAVGLGTSAMHLVGYQEAAERALRAAVPDRPFATLQWSATGREIFERQAEAYTAWNCWLVEDGLAAPSRLRHERRHGFGDLKNRVSVTFQQSRTDGTSTSVR